MRTFEVLVEYEFVFDSDSTVFKAWFDNEGSRFRWGVLLMKSKMDDHVNDLSRDANDAMMSNGSAISVSEDQENIRRCDGLSTLPP
jgi:hypothetical protein